MTDHDGSRGCVILVTKFYDAALDADETIGRAPWLTRIPCVAQGDGLNRRNGSYRREINALRCAPYRLVGELDTRRSLQL